MIKCWIKHKVAICGSTKHITNESLIVYEQSCRKGCRKCDMHNLLTPPGLFTLPPSLPSSLPLSPSIDCSLD